MDIINCFTPYEEEEAKLNFTQNEEYIVIELGAGKSFGELALITNKPRSASIITLTSCFFAIMDK